MMINEIYLFSNLEKLNLTDRTLYVIELLEVIHSTLGNVDFSFSGKTKTISDKDELFIEILNYFKAPIQKNLKVKEVDNYYTDDIGSVITIRSSNMKIKFGVGSSNPKIPNNVIIECDNISYEDLSKLFYNGIKVVKPIWGSITKFEIFNDLMQQETHEYKFGYLTYFDNQVILPALPPDYIIKEIFNIGNVIEVSCLPPFNETNLVYLDKLRTLINVFRRENKFQK